MHALIVTAGYWSSLICTLLACEPGFDPDASHTLAVELCFGWIPPHEVTNIRTPFMLGYTTRMLNIRT